ncbi:hypothetical protein C1645_828173 [Glomus cerebriforme]|uniref:Uncharacterized protein n=1 Tax=Glomus cerebriforme TaxID=658196 RepID=A0A397ST03_9GLOM|nr:hypothetical protein C1645_828173 [Glomus cerebriforme]
MSDISALAHENCNNIEMKACKGKYDIKVELVQDNIKQNFDNEQEEKDKIIPNNENDGSTSKKYNVLSLCFSIFFTNLVNKKE